MQIAEIKVADLPDFVSNNLWKQLAPKPLTILRAISQSLNPRANPDDIALIIAYENNTIVGLVGLLPDLINGQEDQKASSNTCWWVDPEKGKQLAIPLFLRAFALCSQRMFMTDCTPHTLSILEKTNWFDFPEVAPGIRGFMKFNLNEIIPAKLPSIRKLKPLLKLADQTLNFLLIPYQKLQKFRILNKVDEVEYLDSIDPELHVFIENHSQNEFTQRSGKELEWITKYPWIKGRNTCQSVAPVDYPFSYIVENFEQYLVKITASGQTIGLLLISVRDGHLKVPYAWFHEKDATSVLQVIYLQVLLKNAVTLTVFSPRLIVAMHSGSHPFIFRMKIKRLIAISKQLAGLYNKYPEFQDGDGDIVFT
jgi:hypothetical protein